MKKIKDRVILGAICGIIASTAAKVPNAIEYKKGMTDVRFNQLAASLFVPQRIAKANTTDSKIIASMVNNTMSGVTGVAITYILSVTGRDKAMIKGAGIGALQWIGIYGFLSRLGIIVKPRKPSTNILSFIDHTAFGAAAALLISKLGDDSLFPDKKVKQGEKLPLSANSDQELKSGSFKGRRIKNA